MNETLLSQVLNIPNLPDEELGRRLLSLVLFAHAQMNGFDANDPDFVQGVLPHIREMADDFVPDDCDFLVMPLRLAASGKYEEAGRKLRRNAKQNAVVAHSKSIAKAAATGVAVCNGGRKGGKAAQGEIKDRYPKYRDLIAEIRADNPLASPNKIYEIAEAASKNRFGKRVSYKTFERADKRTEDDDTE